MAGISDGLSRSRRIKSGSFNNTNIALAMRLVVVSWPAKRIWSMMGSNSAVVSGGSPSTSVLIMMLSRSSVGFCRRSSILGTKYSCNSTTALATSRRRSWLSMSILPEIIRSPQCLKVQMSARSTPKISAITVTGSGTANSGSKSTDPRVMNASIKSFVMARIWGSNALTLRGLSAFAISFRCRVWTGGSAVNKAFTMGWA